MVVQEKMWKSQILKKWKETKESTEMSKYKNVMVAGGEKKFITEVISQFWGLLLGIVLSI